jgi:DNA-binding Lrp family transcriptional regulator
MRDIELKLLAELMKNSHRSDRELARTLGSSQPTITRIRNRLEKEGIIKEYTMVPDFFKLGYTLMGLTFVTLKKGLDIKEIQKAREAGKNALEEVPCPVIMSERGRGLGYDGMMIILCKNYAEYIDCMRCIENLSYIEGSRVESFLVSLEDEVRYLPITFRVLVKHVAMLKGKEEKKA